MTFRRKILLAGYKLTDTMIVVGSLAFSIWVVAPWVRRVEVAQLLSLRISVASVVAGLLVVLGWHLVFRSAGLYRSRRMDRHLQEPFDIVKATTAGSILCATIGAVFDIRVLAWPFAGLFWVTSTLATITFRLGLRWSLARVRLQGRNLRPVIIVGTNQRAYDYALMIDERRELGYLVAGFVDDYIHVPDSRVTLLGRLKDFADVVRSRVIDEVIIALPVKSYYEEIQKIVAKAEERGVVVRFVSMIFDARIGESRVEVVDRYPTQTIASAPRDGWAHEMKRGLDAVIASMLIFATLPIMALAAIAIRCSSPGPVFFVQNRTGKNGRVFRLLKFRTMVDGAEAVRDAFPLQNEMDGPVFKMREDPRVTTAGRILRKYSVDELPQLFNVLKGDMSLVGPRPLPMRDYDGFTDGWQNRRFSVLPGITCTWQVSGRNEIGFDEWMRMDMEYVDNWKLSTDLKILLKTIPTVLSGKGV